MAKFVIENGVLKKYNGDDTDVIIPDIVTSIGNNVFENHAEIISVTISENVTSIGDRAFQDCRNLAEINIPNSVSDIGMGAFINCKELQKITLSQNIVNIGENSFSGCSKLSSISIPVGVTRIAKSTFVDCTALADIDIPNTVESIGFWAFRDCQGIKKITIPESVTEIDAASFENCINLTEIAIPGSVKKIGFSAFEGCRKLRHVILANGISNIEEKVFRNCSELTEIVIPESITKIGREAFSGCYSLKNIIIPETITDLGHDLFSGCKDILINGKTELIVNNSLQFYAGKDSCVEIPEGVTKIENGVFRGHSEITSITIPESVTIIGNGAFEGCNGLKNVTLPEGVREIGSGAFRGCSGLKDITIPNSVSEIGSSAFEGCSELTSISMPAEIASFGNYVFEGCSKLKELFFPYGVINFGMNNIRGCTRLERIHIPASVKKLSVDSYYRLDSLKQIIIDPNTRLEEVENAEEFLKYQFEISPCPMIPISIIKEPKTKLAFFFEYCKNPEKSPNHIADGYEKYGKSQQLRILREAEAQNRTEVIAYYEKKGMKTSERKLTAKEKVTLLQEIFEKGTEEELRQVLEKHRTFSNGPELLEKTVVNGDIIRARILLDHGISFSAETDCFYKMLTSEEITNDTKYSMCELCLSHCETGNFRNYIALTACILNDEKIIELWKQYTEPGNYLKITQTVMYENLFRDLPMEEYKRALLQLLELTDPLEKPEIHIYLYYDRNAYQLRNIYQLKNVFTSAELMSLILNRFSLDKEQYGKALNDAVGNNDNATFELILSNCPIDKSVITDSIDDFIWAIRNACSARSKYYLNYMFTAGWIQTAIEVGGSYAGWEKEPFLDAIKSGTTETLETLIENNWLWVLPSSFKKSEALETAVSADNPGALAIFEKQGWIRTATLRDKLIEKAANEKKNNALAWLLDYKNRTANPAKEEKVRERKEKQSLQENDNNVVSTVKKSEAWKTTKLPDGTYAVTRYYGEKNNEGTLTIPAMIGKKNISTIRKNAFNPDTYSSEDNKKAFYTISRVIISEGIKRIEETPFCWLVAIAIPESVNDIAENAFVYCKDVVIFGKAGSYAQRFSESSGIKFISNDNSDTQIPDFWIHEGTLIRYCGGETDPVVPNDVTQMIDTGEYSGIGSFSYNTELSTVILPEGLINIGNRAFYGCSGLKSITIPESVTRIGMNAFNGCTGLTTITIPPNVKSIEKGAFDGCSELVNISFSNGLEKIEEYAFAGCKNLTDIVLPLGVTKIGYKAFHNCSGLKNIDIPETVKCIEKDAFAGCTGLPGESDEFQIINNILIAYNENKADVFIPDGVTAISDEVFVGHKEIISISVPDSVTNIGNRVFAGCSSLERIILPEKLRYYGSNVFSECTGLIKDDEKFLIIHNSLEIYHGNDINISIPDGVTSIQDDVFRGHNEITSISIPESVKSIGNRAFVGCSGLKKITIPSNVSRIDSYAFRDCSSLTHIDISVGVEFIGYGAFENCKKLRNVVLPEGINEIKYWTFKNCKALTKVTIPKSVRYIDVSAFGECSESKLQFLVYADSEALKFAESNGWNYEVIEK